MKVKDVVEILMDVKASYPSLSNMEVIELMKLKTKMEGAARNGR